MGSRVERFEDLIALDIAPEKVAMLKRLTDVADSRDLFGKD